MNLFSYATLAGYEWQHPRLLLLLALVPLLPLLRWLLARRRRQVPVAFGPGGLRADPAVHEPALAGAPSPGSFAASECAPRVKGPHALRRPPRRTRKASR